MLPHTKRIVGRGKILNAMGVAVPIFFMILYYVKFGAGDKGCNQKLDINYTYHSANATSIYGNYTLKIMGNGMRDGFIMIIGYFF